MLYFFKGCKLSIDINEFRTSKYESIDFVYKNKNKNLVPYAMSHLLVNVSFSMTVNVLNKDNPF